MSTESKILKIRIDATKEILDLPSLGEVRPLEKVILSNQLAIMEQLIILQSQIGDLPQKKQYWGPG